VRGPCECCGREMPNLGPFRADGHQWAAVCGGCKVRITLRDPRRRARLERDVRRFAQAALSWPGRSS
jgi:hypothetical protein